MKFVQKMYSLFVWYIFKTAAIKKKKKKSLWFQSIPLSKYPYTLGSMGNIWFHTKVNKFFFLTFNAKKGGQNYFPPPSSIFKSREGNCPQLFRPWSGISEVRTAYSYGASEFMSVRIFSCLCVSVFSFLGIRIF